MQLITNWKPNNVINEPINAIDWPNNANKKEIHATNEKIGRKSKSLAQCWEAEWTGCRHVNKCVRTRGYKQSSHTVAASLCLHRLGIAILLIVSLPCLRETIMDMWLSEVGGVRPTGKCEWGLSVCSNRSSLVVFWSNSPAFSSKKVKFNEQSWGFIDWSIKFVVCVKGFKAFLFIVNQSEAK